MCINLQLDAINAAMTANAYSGYGFDNQCTNQMWQNDLLTNIALPRTALRIEVSCCGQPIYVGLERCLASKLYIRMAALTSDPTTKPNVG